jgi:hypothetical protein
MCNEYRNRKSVRRLIDQCETLTFNAAQRADALYDQGDLEGFIVWRKVIRAIEQLERQKPNVGEAVN